MEHESPRALRGPAPDGGWPLGAGRSADLHPGSPLAERRAPAGPCAQRARGPGIRAVARRRRKVGRMSRTPVEEAAPTLIIPRGTRIVMDADGLLSIHAPGNVVVQNSGKYGT